ncbi:DNA-directed RNA polymerase II largest subunit, putative, partial [Perkinsus marinus ATCC 50983]
MTLNTFHLAGVCNNNVTLGFPRLKEIIKVAKNLKTPSRKVYLHPGYASDDAKAKQVLTVAYMIDDSNGVFGEIHVVYPDPISSRCSHIYSGGRQAAGGGG